MMRSEKSVVTVVTNLMSLLRLFCLLPLLWARSWFNPFFGTIVQKAVRDEGVIYVERIFGWLTKSDVLPSVGVGQLLLVALWWALCSTVCCNVALCGSFTQVSWSTVDESIMRFRGLEPVRNIVMGSVPFILRLPCQNKHCIFVVWWIKLNM